LKIQELINSYLGISEIEKKKYGEVFTPFSLINEMLDTLPKEVWSNPNLKWGDFANGIGNFPAVVIQRLMEGLKEWEPDDEKRYKHIIENQIYTCEIQSKNIFIFLMLFNPDNKYKMNFYTGSFLEEGFDKHMKEVWGLDGFDIVMGNPPYQDGTGGKSKGTGNTLWNLFVDKSLKTPGGILNESGYLVMVHPSGWRNPFGGTFSKLWKTMSSKYILYLSINDINDGLKVFGAATRYDYYCLKNEDCKKRQTTIKYQDGTISKMIVTEEWFIPNEKYEEFKKILAKDENDRITTIYSSSIYEIRKDYVQKEQDNTHIYPIIKYIPKTKDDLELFWSSKNLGQIGIPKVIFGVGSQVGRIIVDKDGKFGMYCFSMGVNNGNDMDLENIKNAMESEKFKDLMKACQFNTEMYNRKIISLLKKDFWKYIIGN